MIAAISAWLRWSARGAVKEEGGSVMGQILELEYVARLGWVEPLLEATARHPRLKSLLPEWGQHRLSDLSFAVETRLEYLPDLTKRMDDNLTPLVDDILEASQPLADFLRLGAGLRYMDRKNLNGLLIAASGFISESRALFESLADF